MQTSREVMRGYASKEVFDKIVDFDSVSEMWEHSVSEYKDDIALSDGGTEYTYETLNRDVAAYRAVLCGAVSKENARIGLYAPNSYAFVKAFLAITTLGHTAVILPAQLPDAAVLGCSVKFGLDALVYAPSLAEKAKATGEKLPIALLDTESKSDTYASSVKCKADTPCVIMFTGGTTGKSKGALLSNAAVMQGTVNGCYGCSEVFRQRYLLVLPLSHVFGLIRNLLTSLYTGSTLYICQNPKDMFRDIAVFRPTYLVLVPALAEMALNLSQKMHKNMLGADLKYIICGAAPVAPYLIREYDKLGIRLCPGYGLTESANLVSGNPDSLTHPDSVGRMYPNQEYRIVDGELWLRGRNMLTEYVGEPESAYTDDGWFRTGDLVRIDDDGFLYITGRIKEMIVLPSGENVYPAELESLFNTVPYVRDSQVYEDMTESGNHFLALEVVPRETELGARSKEEAAALITAELNRINETLPSYEKIQKIIIRDTDFERTPSMKIVRYKKCN